MTRRRATAALAGVSAAIAIFSPSSLGGSISPMLTVAAFVLLLLLTLTMGWLNDLSEARWTGGMVMVGVLLLATLVSPLRVLAPGALLPFLLLAGVFSLDLRPENRGAPLALTVFEGISIVIQVFAVATVLDLPGASSTSMSYYQAFYEGLYEQTVVWYRKPVTVFGTHSIAALMYLAFLATHLQVLKTSQASFRVVLHGISVIVFLGVLFLLRSNTGLAMFGVSLGLIAIQGLRRAPRRTLLIALPVAIIVAPKVFARVYEIVGRNESFLETVTDVTLSSGNGFFARYSRGGRLQPTYDLIVEHPFRPVGLTTDEARVSFGDNFVGEYIVRGSLLLYLVVLAVSGLFWRRNLVSGRNAVAFFLFFLMCDLGYPLLPYYRAAGSIVLFVLVWNHCALIGTVQLVACNK